MGTVGVKTSRSFPYTALGKVESVVDSLNNRQEFTYDSMGRNTIVRDALNNTSTAEYDMLGNVTKLVGPLGGTTNHTRGRFCCVSKSLKFLFNNADFKKCGWCKSQPFFSI